ncbi:hypothetical protein MHB44_19985 [Lysinibacillus sp. FSL H8-0500]|uniref:hypothetical protein n=1 Tax=Lysinibacillus sp. FSL H8-0500 TaxID=2921393 RepID=UPI0031010ED3
MRYHIFTTISILCLLLIIFMFGYDSTKWYGSFFKFLYGLSVFVPFILSMIGIISALFGVKGDFRKILVILHIFLFLILLGIYFMA